MKIFHTADWHLGKLVQGVYMTEDQAYILDEFMKEIDRERPDVIIIAGDLYDRAVPPTEAVKLLNDVLERIVLGFKIPVIAIAGNHDSPSRIHFGSSLLKNNGLHLVGNMDMELEPIILEDKHGEVHFHLIPYADPSIVRNLFKDDTIRSHNDAMKKAVEKIREKMDSNARHVAVGHAFVTPYGEKEANTSDSERPLSIGGSEYVEAGVFEPFHYTALGHLHQAHYVLNERIQYAGSLLKYSISEENHKKGFLIVELDDKGDIEIEKRLLIPLRDMRTVEGYIEDILEFPQDEDYVFVRLLNETPVLSPMEKVRSVFPNAMHVERKYYSAFPFVSEETASAKERAKMTDMELFRAFYEEVRGEKASEQAEAIFAEALESISNNDK